MRPGTFLLRCLAAALLLVTGLSAARAADPFARAAVVTEGTLYPGQQIEIAVDVLVPNFFMSSPQFPLFDLPNAVVTLPDTGALNLNETVDGETFAGIRRTYLVTPQAPGDYALPPAEIAFTYAAVPGQASDGKVTLPPTRFTVASAPGGAAGGGASVTAARVSITQALDRDLEHIKVGDALVRTVTIAADSMQAMMIPAPDFEAPDGVRIYRHDPRLEDEKTSRGEFTAGKRTDTVTYAFEKPGAFTLPAVEIDWFDPASGKNETASAPAIDVSVADAAAAQTGIAPPAPVEPAERVWKDVDWRKWVPLAVIGIAGVAAVLWLALWLAPKTIAGIRLRRIERESSEAAYFHRFEQACRGKDRRAAYDSLDRWARRAALGQTSEWLRRYGDPGSQRAYEALERSIFGGNANVTPDLGDLGMGIGRARLSWLAKQPQQDATHLPSLSPLNPQWTDGNASI